MQTKSNLAVMQIHHIRDIRHLFVYADEEVFTQLGIFRLFSYPFDGFQQIHPCSCAHDCLL